MIKTNILGDETPKENVHYACISCMIIDSVMRLEKRICLEECKYEIKKVKINVELESDSSSDSE